MRSFKRDNILNFSEVNEILQSGKELTLDLMIGWSYNPYMYLPHIPHQYRISIFKHNKVLPEFKSHTIM